MTPDLQRCVAEYERQAAADAATADHSLLADGLAAFERSPLDQRLASDNVRAAVKLFMRLRKRAESVDLLTEYLARDLSTDDEEWARWERTDNLALMRRFEETVEAQRDDFAWAKARLEPHRWLRVMYDGTQALAWWGSGRLDDWLAIVHELRAAVPINECTREAWFHLNRTEARVLEQGERIDDALAAADRVGVLADRYPEWDWAEMVRLEGDLTRMSVLTRAGRDEDFDAAADRVIARLAEFPATPTVAPDGPNQYVVLCHNAAARLYSAKRYKRAARLFREAARGKAPYLTYIFLAACVWASTQDRHEVMDCLREAAKRDPSESVWRRAQRLPELADLADDEEVKAAAAGA